MYFHMRHIVSIVCAVVCCIQQLNTKTTKVPTTKLEVAYYFGHCQVRTIKVNYRYDNTMALFFCGHEHQVDIDERNK